MTRTASASRPRPGFTTCSIRVARDLHAIARNRMLTGLALGYTPDGGIDFGLSREELGETTGAPYGILLHATARGRRNGPRHRGPRSVARSPCAEVRSCCLGDRGGARAQRAHRCGARECPRGERQPLDRMAALIAGASFVIGVDTGLIHLAAALGVPLVAIFVAASPAHRTEGDWTDRSRWGQAPAAVRLGCPRCIRTAGLSIRRADRSGQMGNARLRSMHGQAHRQ